jgi:hypothetical protein
MCKIFSLVPSKKPVTRELRLFNFWMTKLTKTSMPLASINFTNPRTNPWNFHKKFENWRFWKTPWKLVKATWLSRMGLHFDDYLGFRPKITQPKCLVCLSFLWWQVFFQGNERKYFTHILGHSCLPDR